MRKLIDTKENQALYKEGDTITTHLNVKGVIWKILFNEASKEWVYCYKNERGMGCVKESNITKKNKKKI